MPTLIAFRRKHRTFRPSLESLEGRALLTGSGLTVLGGSGIASEVVTHNASGQEELYVQLASNYAIYSYSYSTGQFVFTGGYLTSMVADSTGITGIGGGTLFHYDDQKGYTMLGGSNLAQVVVSQNPTGQQEAFARAASNSAIYEYNFTTKNYSFTGGYLNSMIADDTGITGVTGGGAEYLFHYQDGSGYLYTGGSGITNYAVTHNLAGQEVVFVRTATYGSIFYYTYSTGQFTNTGGTLDNFVANANGITGTINGLLFYYNFGPNFYFTGASNITSELVSHDPVGREEVFAKRADGTILDYVYAANEWHSTSGSFNQMVADDNGITGISGATNVLYHYQDNEPDLGSVGSNYLLGNVYSGAIADDYEPPIGVFAGRTTGSISISIEAASPTLLGYDIWGSISVSDSAGVFRFTQNFVGYYNIGVFPFLEIESVPDYGRVPANYYSFSFIFGLTNGSNGNSQYVSTLLANNGTADTFKITSPGGVYDDKNNVGDSGTLAGLGKIS